MNDAIYVMLMCFLIQLFIIVNVLLDIRTEMRKQTKLWEEQDEPIGEAASPPSTQ